MFIVLPPSESKARPSDPSAPTLDLESFSIPELTEARRTMLHAAARTAQLDDGRAMLGVPASAPELLSRMAALELEPVGAPLDVYTGVLYDALGSVDLSPTSIPVTDSRRVFVMSALFGLVDCARDLIPAYRLSAGSRVVQLGKVGTWWKKHLKPLAEMLPNMTGVVVDCRSGAYRSMMPFKGSHVLEVSPVAYKDGTRTVVSHDAKRYRGLVAKELLDSAEDPSTPDDVVDLLKTAFGETLGVELTAGSACSTLTIIDYWDRR